MNDTERWLPIPGFDGRYDVSDLGRVRSWVHWNGRPSPRILKPCSTSKGYLTVGLTPHGGRSATKRVHQMVLLAFVGPQPKGLEVRHLDGSPNNNTLPNLTYGTKSENRQDSLRHGTHHLASKTHCDKGHPFTVENTYLHDGGHRRCLICKRAYARAYYHAFLSVYSSTLRGGIA